MHRDLVDERRWISEARFLHALNYCMVLPGPEAQQLATYIGWLMHGTRGGIIAGALFVLPSFAILVTLSWLYMAYGNVPAVAGVLHGVKPAVVALVLHAAWRIGSRTLKHPVLWLIAALSFAAIFAWSVPFPAIVLAAGVAGIAGGRAWPHAFRLGTPHAKAAADDASAAIGDGMPTPAHARWNVGRCIVVIAAFVALFALALGALVYAFGAGSTLVHMGWFFTQAAFLTFGGAYAVLPYVFQAAVENYAWLTATQMIDGLALGESTPGPLIMVVAFVGFVGAWTHAIFGPGSLVLAGIAGAGVATFFTFLPSFLFILAGGPLVESTHGRMGFTAPLTAITAAVVGVIVNLAAFFAWHVFWPRGFAGGVDATGIAIFAAAAYALFRTKAGVVPVIAACGAAGLLLALL